MAKILLTGPFASLTNDRKSWSSTCGTVKELLCELGANEPLLFSAIMESNDRLKPFVSIVVDEVPYFSTEDWGCIGIRPDSTVLVISAVAGG